MKRLLISLIAVAALAGPVTFAQGGAPTATVAKKCGKGWKHAKINGRHECLRLGAYCKPRFDRQYHRYGFHCHKRKTKGSLFYHLS